MENTGYFKIGLFVISAIMIALVGVVILGGGYLLQHKYIIETYIDESVQGLDIGSPVKFRGVPIGKVDEITLTSMEYPTQRRYVLVRAGISPDWFRFQSGDPARRELIVEVEKGLRVRLAPQGLTGQAYLEADYLDPLRSPPLEIDWRPDHPYVPSALSRITQFTDAFESIMRNLEDIDIPRLVQTVDKSMAVVSRLVEDAEFDKISVQAVALLSELRQTNQQLKGLVGGPELKVTLRDAAVAASTARQILERADRPLSQLVADLPKTSESLDRLVRRLDEVAATLPDTGAEVRQTLQSLNRLIGSQQQDIERTIENLRVMSENIKEVVDNTAKYPSQVLFGSPPPPSKVMGR